MNKSENPRGFLRNMIQTSQMTPDIPGYHQEPQNQKSQSGTLTEYAWPLVLKAFHKELYEKWFVDPKRPVLTLVAG